MKGNTVCQQNSFSPSVQQRTHNSLLLVLLLNDIKLPVKIEPIGIRMSFLRWPVDDRNTRSTGTLRKDDTVSWKQYDWINEQIQQKISLTQTNATASDILAFNTIFAYSQWNGLKYLLFVFFSFTSNLSASLDTVVAMIKKEQHFFMQSDAIFFFYSLYPDFFLYCKLNLDIFMNDAFHYYFNNI